MIPIRDLPLLLDASSWRWEAISEYRAGLKAGMWIGHDDTTGARWLVKMRGPDKAIRERTFAALAPLRVDR